ncbi:MAG: hypothetical protein ABIQ04_00100 [Candidatus Saccharimonadales bacterium]
MTEMKYTKTELHARLGGPEGLNETRKALRVTLKTEIEALTQLGASDPKTTETIANLTDAYNLIGKKWWSIFVVVREFIKNDDLTNANKLYGELLQRYSAASDSLTQSLRSQLLSGPDDNKSDILTGVKDVVSASFMGVPPRTPAKPVARPVRPTRRPNPPSAESIDTDSPKKETATSRLRRVARDFRIKYSPKDPTINEGK